MQTEDGEQIIFLRMDGTPVEYAVFEGGCDEATGEMIFFELIGYSGDVKPKLLLNDCEVYKRLLIRRCFPAIKINLLNPTLLKE